MRVVHVASEVAPWAQTGGLADVVAALPAAQVATGEATCAIVAPLYRIARAKLAVEGAQLAAGPDRTIRVGPYAFPARIVYGATRAGVPIAWVDAPFLFDRDGIYGPGGTSEFLDNALRFGALCRAAVDVADEIAGGPVDVIHGHDWQGALAATYARLDPARADVVTMTTIHNLAFRGLAPKLAVDALGLPWSYFDMQHFEFWDQLSLLKAGLAFADAATTVSPSYVEEILTPHHGEGLDGFLLHDVRSLVGITNGIDTVDWDPAADPRLAAPFSAERPAGKLRCRAALATELGLTLDATTPLAAVVVRMTGQKGVDLIADIVPVLPSLGVKLAVLGNGEPALEARFLHLAETFPEHVAVRIGFDHALARRMYAGADLFLMPSRFEPCGLGQLYAMRYGTIPIVSPVGGLRDTVDDPGDVGIAAGLGTGFKLPTVSTISLLATIERAVTLYRTQPALWRALVLRAMRRDSSWSTSARAYLTAYRVAARGRVPETGTVSILSTRAPSPKLTE